VNGARYPGLARNAVVAASAGTGKTHFLTNLFLSRALGLGPEGRPVAAERIVATSFSRAAALELRERIEQRLRAVADPDLRPTAALDEALLVRVRELELDDSVLRERALRAQNELSAATIDTLHGVAIWVLRRFALELGLVPNFAVLDEQQATADLIEVIEHELAAELDAGGVRERSARALIDACYGLESTTVALRFLLERLDDEGLNATELESSGELEAAARLRSELLAICDRIAADGPTALSEPARVVTRTLAVERPEPAALVDALVGLFEVRFTATLKRLPGTLALDAFLEQLRGANKPERARGLAGFLHLAPELEANTSAFAALVARIQKALLARRTQRGGFGFGDLLRVARDALRDRPAIAALAAEQIDTLLVDEFQDTSRVQRDLILLLRERPASAARRPPGRLPRAADLLPSGLVVVGDRKQSIYGFRGADVSVFAELAAELAGAPALEALELSGVELSGAPVADFASLSHNYRSAPAILESVNLIARQDFAERPTRPYEVRYADAEALAPPLNREAAERGRVTLIRDEGGVPDSAEPIVAGAEGPLRSAFVAAGFCLRSAAEGVAYRDMAVLARRRSTLPLVELALDRVRVPYVVSGRALYATREVRDLFAALRLACDPLDRHALAVVARGLLGGLTDPTLAALCEPRRGLTAAPRWNLEAIDEPEQRQAARLLRERLADFSRVAPRLSPRDALAFAVELFELESVLAALPRGQVRLGNAWRLIEIAARQGGGLSGFTRWLEQQIATEADETEAAVFSEEDDAVRLVTIHGSKGLAFPVVILLDVAVAEQPRNPTLSLFRDGTKPPVLVFRQRSALGALHHPAQRAAYEDLTRRANAERQRLSYVAITRPKRELALVLPTEGTALKAGSLAFTLAELRASGRLAAIDGVRELEAQELLALEHPGADSGPERPAPPPRRPQQARVTALPVAATALGDFALCQRRFELIHVLGLDEPALSGSAPVEATSDDPRTLGSAAHRLLERWPLQRWGESTSVEAVSHVLGEDGLDPGSPATLDLAAGLARFLSGAFAAQVRGARRVERELELATIFELGGAPAASARRRRAPPNPLQLDLFAGSASTPLTADGPSARVLLKTTLDLLVEHEDGSIDIVDYKRSKGRFGERYFLQLSAYRSAVARHYAATRVRTGLVHLQDESPEPIWSEPSAFDVAALAAELTRARWEERFEPVEKPRCERIGCGFVSTCHRAKAR
jgi:ATP-dependent helicase/nuclease subunit A